MQPSPSRLEATPTIRRLRLCCRGLSSRRTLPPSTAPTAFRTKPCSRRFQPRSRLTAASNWKRNKIKGHRRRCPFLLVWLAKCGAGALARELPKLEFALRLTFPASVSAIPSPRRPIPTLAALLLPANPGFLPFRLLLSRLPRCLRPLPLLIPSIMKRLVRRLLLHPLTLPHPRKPSQREASLTPAPH